MTCTNLNKVARLWLACAFPSLSVRPFAAMGGACVEDDGFRCEHRGSEYERAEEC